MRAEVNSLYRLDPPCDSRPPIQVAHELLSLYRSDFSLSLASICRIFCCERGWAEHYILPNVQHIFVTHYFGLYIAKNLQSELIPQEINDFSHRMYFLSRKSLVEFYRANAVADQKTQMVDITLYRDRSVSFSALLRERDRHASAHGGGRAEKHKHLENMREMLTDEGFNLYEDSLLKDKEWIRTPLPVLPLKDDDIRFMDTALAAKRFHLNSATSVHNHMVRNGAVRVKFGGKLLWYIPPYTGKWLIPCSYDPKRRASPVPFL